MNLVQLIITILLVVILLPKDTQQIKNLRHNIVKRMSAKDQEIFTDFRQKSTHFGKQTMLCVIVLCVLMAVITPFVPIMFNVISILIAVLFIIIAIFSFGYNKTYPLLLKYARSDEKKKLRSTQIRNILLFIVIDASAWISVISLYLQ
ncbi:hypothetical protein [Holzapfeliella sp. JNUCC 72]